MNTLSTQDIIRAVFDIVEKFELDSKQIHDLSNSAQLNHIIDAAQFGRWDQVTLMLYQDGILRKKNA